MDEMKAFQDQEEAILTVSAIPEPLKMTKTNKTNLNVSKGLNKRKPF